MDSILKAIFVLDFIVPLIVGGGFLLLLVICKIYVAISKKMGEKILSRESGSRCKGCIYDEADYETINDICLNCRRAYTLLNNSYRGDLEDLYIRKEKQYENTND